MKGNVVLKKLPIGTQSFEVLRSNQNEYIYVDKTQYFYNLINSGRVYFLSRPRRFGKSLTISTLQAIFEGKRELFKNLWIDLSDYDWQQYPVLTFNFALMNNESVSSLQKDIIFALMQHAEKYNITLPPHLTLDQILSYMLEQFGKENKKVVILVDEYDKPILDHIENPMQADALRQTLAQFYSVIKNLDQYIKFVFITGVTKFSKTSIFSGLNNLKDLTLTKQAATLCGYTQTELETYFENHIKNISSEQNINPEILLKKLKQWYNGYRFCHKGEMVYNPFSILLCLDEGAFDNYWIKTGTPRFLPPLLQKNSYPAIDFEHAILLADDIESFDIHAIHLVNLLFQTGYLTIKDYDELSRRYTLGYPNEEVSFTLNLQILRMLTNFNSHQIDTINNTIRNALYTCNIDQLCQTFQHFYDQIPYTIHLPQEKYWQSLIYVLLMQLGLQVRVEEATSLGRIDLLITTPDAFFVIEFKIDDTSGIALQQIKEKRYADKFKQINKKIFLVGIAFDSKTKKIEYLWEKE